MVRQKKAETRRKFFADEIVGIRQQAMDLVASGQSYRSIFTHYREQGLISMSFETFYRYMKSFQNGGDTKISRNDPFDYLVLTLMRQGYSLKSIHMFLREKSLCNVSYSTFCRYVNGEKVLYCHEFINFTKVSSLADEFYMHKELYVGSESKNYRDNEYTCSLKQGKLVIQNQMVRALYIEDATAVMVLYNSERRQIALKFFPVLERRTLEVATYRTLYGVKLVVPFSSFCRQFDLNFRHVVYLPVNLDYGLQPGGDPFDVVLDVDGAQRSPVGIALSLRRMADNGYPVHLPDTGTEVVNEQ